MKIAPMTDAESPIDLATLVHYRESLEKPADNEQELIDKIAAALKKNNERAYKKGGKGIRDAHAKSHGILRGQLTVDPNLLEPLRQGMFATPGATYDVIVRLSTTAGVVRSDQVRGIRGLALKVLEVPGPKVLPDWDPTHNQDFVFVTHPVFPTGNAKEYLWKGVPLAWVLAHAPDKAMLVVNATLRGARRALNRVGKDLPDAIGLFAGENTNTLGETFYTAAPIRYGDYVAKLNIAPKSPSVTHLIDTTVSSADGKDAHTDAVKEFFAHNSAEYVLSAQLCTQPNTLKLDEMIEDATKEWPVSESPYRPIATISFPVQDTYSDKRRDYGDDVLEFNSWRAIVDHRPLGSINRLKLKVYQESSKYRHKVNGLDRHEPATISELPD